MDNLASSECLGNDVPGYVMPSCPGRFDKNVEPTRDQRMPPHDHRHGCGHSRFCQRPDKGIADLLRLAQIGIEPVCCRRP